MESWSYMSGGKGLVVDDSVSGTGGIQEISKTGLLSSEMKSPWSYGCNEMISNQGGDQIQEFVDLGSSYMMRKSLPNDSIGDTISAKISDRRVIGSISVPANAYSCEDDSSSMFSSSVVESNPRDSSLIDLKLGSLGDQGDVETVSASVAKTNFSSSESSIPVKRARAGSLGSQTPYCQVHGCRKDLSSCKDYHKRHKVCEIHSKTTRVIVNGIEQRFCQQCSRFHLLAEFDDGKRSCRKRLAGHNERRRKPHNHIHTVRSGRLLHSFNTMRPEGNSLSASSFVCQDILPACHLRDHNSSSRLVKLEGGTDIRSHFTITDDEQRKSLFTQQTAKKQCHSLEDDGLSVMTKGKINENNSYFQDIADSRFVSRIAFPNFPLGNEDTPVLDSSSTIGGFSDVANSGHALSLLSSQSHCSLIPTSGLPIVLPLVSSGSRALYPLNKPPEKLLGVSSQAPTSGLSSAFSSSPLSSAEKNHVGNMFDSNGGGGTNGIDRILQQSAYMSNKNHFPFQQSPTIDLLQLSTQLQRVEHQRESLMMKHEDNNFSGFRNS